MQFTQSGFSTILNPRSQCPYTGKESVQILDNGVKLFIDPTGSERYVMYLNGRAVSALQIMVKDQTAVVANVITDKKHRRKGFATIVWNEAKKRHSVINHSQSLSEEGKIFALKRN